MMRVTTSVPRSTKPNEEPSQVPVPPIGVTILTELDAAKMLGLSQSTMSKLRMRGAGPRFCKLGRRVGYDPADLREWVDANKRQSTGAK